MILNTPVRHAFAALAVYAALAAIIMWHGANLATQLSGVGSDPFDSTWYLSWWPYALSHHLNPFYTKLMWFPYGEPVAWVTSVPLLALLCWPITAHFGAVVSYNLLIITAPPCAAWSGYFLCRHVSRDDLAGFIGGFLLGYSSYEMAESVGALNLAVIFLIPLLLLLILYRLDDRIGRARFMLLAALLLVAQFLIGTEILATSFVFGGIAWGLALLYLPARRLVLRRLLRDGLCTAPLVILALAPLLWSMALHAHLIKHPVEWPYFFTADLCGIVIPPGLNLFGAPFVFLSKHFNGGMQEDGTYIGLPLLALLWLYARAEWRAPRGKFLLLCLLVFWVCSLGPYLWVDGHFTHLMLPWSLLVNLPLLTFALTVRFGLFMALAVAIITSIWLAPPRRAAKLALAMLGCVLLLPHAHPWRPAPVARFFAPGRVQAILGPNPKLLILPFAINGPSSFWQTENDYGFTLVGGYLGPPLAPAQKYLAVGDMYGNIMEPGFLPSFTRYAEDSGAQYVVAGPGTKPAMLAAIASLGWQRRQVDDVTILTVPAP